jgi:hypothetical protein
MFHIVAREGVNSLVCEMKSDLADSLGSEANHTVDDTPGVEAFVAFDHALKISKMEFYNHVIT